MFKESETFWQDVLEQVMSLDIDEAWLFDTLVVDEGQDFQEDWVEIVKLFLKENASILWLEDKEQKLVFGQPVKLDQFVSYHCNINYRSPEKIARFILNTLPIQFEIGNPLPGFNQDEIYIVSCKGANKSVFNKLDKIGNLPLSHFTGNYDDGGQQIMTDGLLHFDSIYRFKGLESPAVILVDIEFDVLNKHQQHVLFCGMTRATVKLDLLVNTNKEGSRQLFT